ncbi:hypothetical protein MSG28_011896 [Choristoneura fumiferana]|uniref:Uncharacterized protein n=1 Tax=Choristoneura fumiferana TaxID=7141 RepID=A0ACC0KMY4_CHOFU|nr:hypothetical protein MSG28_011896 [Choristoneura fumiferana]
MTGEGAVHGWGCTPPGENPQPAVEHPGPACLPAVVFRGWRKTALYCILVFLMVLIFLNIGLTLWIISSLKLRMSAEIWLWYRAGGQAFVADSLVASTIRSRSGQPLTVHSYRNFTVLVSEPERKETAKLMLKRDRLECSGRTFEVRDEFGGSVFRASRNEVHVFADALAANGEGGVTVQTAVQTPQVRAPPGADLQLESLTRHLDLRAPQSIYLESRAGGIDVTSHSNIKLDSVVGASLKEAVRINETRRNKNLRSQRVYQLCSCSSGKLFLAAAEGTCTSNDADTEFCR